MTFTKIIKANWLTRKPDASAFWIMLSVGFVFIFVGYSYLIDLINLQNWLPASSKLVFLEHQYWRAWTTLFAHGDLEHLLSNALLFFPLTYFLSAYYGFLIFPILGIFFGGVINLIVLKTMPENVLLVGISGVVYWMGATWLTLFLLLDRRQRLRRRFASALFLTLMLFVPDTYKPSISYLSHFIGYFLGVLSGIAIYFFRRKEFQAWEVVEYSYDDDFFDWNFLDSAPEDKKSPGFHH